ncbi:MAG TPA: TusE/DsrC/DsvC family sulfur relay protein [Thiobacillaceae bacterium]|nr:TusE/DsrC/DsvC family sulfur relay protein [Thiobacillaceae bacterium]
MANTARQALPALDEEGFLLDPADWNVAVATILAGRENILLSHDHWEVLRFVREFQEAHRVIPDARQVVDHLAHRWGDQAARKLHELFPSGYLGQVCRLAGMPNSGAVGDSSGLKGQSVRAPHRHAHKEGK